MKAPTEGRIIIPKPCCLATDDNPCLAVIEWRKDTVLAFKFDLKCGGVTDKEVSQSVEALEGVTCESLQYDIRLPKSTNGWWVEKSLIMTFEQSTLWHFSNAITKRFHQRYSAARHRAYRDLSSKAYGYYGYGRSAHDW